MSLRPERRLAEPDCSAPHRRLYRVYGLIVESELELPELVSAEGEFPEVSIRFGKVPESMEGVISQWSWCVASRSEFLFTIEGVARYHIVDGCRITIERRLGLDIAVPAADIRLWLLGSAFAALLHQRGLLPLHVSAVKAPSGVWAFTGDSGEGKSTLAGFFLRRHGWEVVSDDVSVIDQNGAPPRIQPGPRKLKLWGDALAHLDFNGYEIARDLTMTDKFQLYLPCESGSYSESLHALVLLESTDADEPASIEQLKGLDAFNACLKAVYRPYMDKWFKLPEQRLGDLVRLCQTIHVYRFRRPRSLANFEANLQPLMRLLARIGS